MGNPDLETSEKISFIKLKRMYLFAFISIAIAVILSQILIQYNLNKQQNDSRIINTSGKQRMLSQKITKGILKLKPILLFSNVRFEAGDVVSGSKIGL